MRLWEILIGAAAIGLMIDGISGDWRLVIGGGVALFALFATRAWLHSNAMMNFLETNAPGDSIVVTRSSTGCVVATVTGVATMEAAKAVIDTWRLLLIAYPRQRFNLAVVVRDHAGGYWGTDWMRMNPPYSTLENPVPYEPGNELADAAIKAGSLRVKDGQLYDVVSPPPWGPLAAPAEVGWGLAGSAATT